MSPNVNPKTMLTELREIASQLEATKNVDRERKQFAGLLSAMASDRWLGKPEYQQALQETGVDEEAIEVVMETLQAWAEDLAPTADTTWKRTELDVKIDLLRSMAKLGMLEDDQAAELEQLVPTLTAKRGGGVRGERKPQETIEGRATKVRIIDLSDGSKVAEQKGNVATSPTNLRQAATRYLAKQGVTITDDVKNDLLTAAGSVCKVEQEKVEVHGLRFEVAA